MMEAKKKVVVLVLHDALESAYPPLNLSVGAASTGADVLLVFSREGVRILEEDYLPVPSKGREYLANALADFNVTPVQDLLAIAVELGVRLVAVDADAMKCNVQSKFSFEKVPIKWVLNEAATADLFMHF